MRFVLYILISIVIFTSCKSSFTKRQYRPGVFREHFKYNNLVSLKKQRREQVHIASASINKPNFNLSVRNIDTINCKLLKQENNKTNKGSFKNKYLFKSKKAIHSKINNRSVKAEISPKNTDDKKKERKSVVILGIAALICAILIGIGFFMLSSNAYYWFGMLMIFAFGAIGILLVIMFLIILLTWNAPTGNNVKENVVKEYKD